MNLTHADRLQELILTYPELTRERRELIVDFLLDLPGPVDADQLLESWEPSERAFVAACLGQETAAAAFHPLAPSEQPLIPHQS